MEIQSQIEGIWRATKDRNTRLIWPRAYYELPCAPLSIWKQKQWRAPYYWAAFVLQGEWK